MKKTPSAERQEAAAPGFDSLQQEVFLNLWRTYDCLKMLEDDAFARVGLSAQQYNTLRLLRAAYPDALATRDLGSRLISRAPDMTRLLDRLEQRGLLTRERPAGNRRMVAVCITKQGVRLLDQMHQSVLDCHQRQLGHLDDASLRSLAKLLRAARRPHEDAARRSFIDDGYKRSSLPVQQGT